MDLNPPERAWPALYLALGPEVCLGEVIRHVTPDTLRYLNDYRLSELDVQLSAVLDLRDVSGLGLTPEALLHDSDYRVTQALGAAALAVGSEGVLVPSATKLGDNLVVFTSSLRPGSWLEVLGSRDARLYARRV
jgi:hypothetical protein